MQSTGKINQVPILDQWKPNVLKVEVRRAIKKLKNNTVPRAEFIAAEILKVVQRYADFCFYVC